MVSRRVMIAAIVEPVRRNANWLKNDRVGGVAEELDR